MRIGNMAQFGVAAEMYVVQRWGLSVIGEVYGYPSLTSFPDSPKQVPAEALLGLRWQTKHGITITFGGSFGAACGFGSPAVRFFNGITWQPKSSREQEEINRVLRSDSDDRDHDGLTGSADKCPDMPGSPEDRGCPDIDSDNDGILDRDDECPRGSAGGRGKNGCPSVYIKDAEIVVLEQVHFATGKDAILDESKPILDEIARVLKDHPEVREIVIEGHTDSRAGMLYNMNQPFQGDGLLKNLACTLEEARDAMGSRRNPLELPTNSSRLAACQFPLDRFSNDLNKNAPSP